MNTRIGVISDLHLFNKTTNIERALSKLHDVDMIAMVGDIADRADEKQYGILLRLMNTHFRDMPVYCVSGNHDNPARDDTLYRAFEKAVNAEYVSMLDACGAFYKCLHTSIGCVGLIGLNPAYHQKQFFFSDKGRQLTFLQDKLHAQPCTYTIVMCHPPLIAHNPQRTADKAPYIASEQDTRLQSILDESGHVIFLSGHTHVSPSIEWDEAHGNLYINDGSICPTTVQGTPAQTQQGNVTLLEISETEISVVIKSIHSEKIFLEKRISIT